MTDIKRLVLAMAPIQEVVSVARHVSHQSTTEIPTELSSDDSLSGRAYAEQEHFASIMEECWNDQGPSERYMKVLVRKYVSEIEKDGIITESDTLLNLVLRASMSKDNVPDPNAACYLSFFVGKVAETPLKIRICPYHNDLALRLWEGGAVLAEYFMENKELVANKKIVELGAGVGLTGLVIAGCCNSTSVYMTDYTETCRHNMAHNIQMNQEWLNQGENPHPEIAEGYLEWSSFMKSEDEPMPHIGVEEDLESLRAFCDADLLIAADVMYDPNDLKPIVGVVLRFLRGDPSSKRGIFGITARNMSTFEMFLGYLEDFGVDYTWISSVEECAKIPILFPCKFNQKRGDVRIAMLTMSSEVPNT